MKSKKLLIPALSAVATATMAAPLILTLSSCGTKWDGDDVIKKYIPNFKPLKPEHVQQKINLIDGNDLWVDAYKHNHAIPNEEYKWSSSHISGVIGLLCDLLEAEYGYKPINLSRYNARLYDFRINSEKDGIRRVSYRAVSDIVVDFNFKVQPASNVEIKNIHGSVRLAWSHQVNNMPFGLFDIGTDDVELFTTLLGLKNDPLPEETLWFFGPDMSRVENDDNTWSLDLDFLTEGGVYLNEDKLIDLGNEFKFKLDKYSSYTIESVISALIADKQLPAKLGIAISWQLERLIPMLAGWSSYYLNLINHYDHVNSHQDDEETTYGWKTRTTKDDTGFVWADTSWSNPATIRYELGEKNIYLKGDGDVDLESGEIPDVFCLPIFVESGDNQESGFSLPNISIPEEVIATSYVSNGDTLSVVYDWNPKYYDKFLDQRPENGFSFSQQWRSSESEDKPAKLKNLMSGAFTREKAKEALGTGALVPLIFTKDWVAIGRPFDLCETKNIRFNEKVDEFSVISPITRFEATQFGTTNIYKGNVILQMDSEAYNLFNQYIEDKESLPITMDLVQIESQEHANMALDPDAEWSIQEETDDEGNPTGKYLLTIPFYSDNLGTYGETDPYALQFKYENAAGVEAYCVVGTPNNPIIGYVSTPEELKNEWNPSKSKTILLSTSGTDIADAFAFAEGEPAYFSIERNGSILPDDLIKISVEPHSGNKYNVKFLGGEYWSEVAGYSDCTIKAYNSEDIEIAQFTGFNFINADYAHDLRLQSGAITESTDIQMSPAVAISNAATFVPNGSLPGNGKVKNVTLLDQDYNIASFVRPIGISVASSIAGQTPSLGSIGVSFNALQAAKYEGCVLVVSYEYTDENGNIKSAYGFSSLDQDQRFNLTITAETTYDAEWASEIWNNKVIEFDTPDQDLKCPQLLRLTDSTRAGAEYTEISLSSDQWSDVHTDDLQDHVIVSVVNDPTKGYLTVILKPDSEVTDFIKTSGPLKDVVLEINWLDTNGASRHVVVSDITFAFKE